MFLLIVTLLLLGNKAYSQNPNQTFNAGAYIIDMGQNSTLAKGLKPYGLVYTLIHDHEVPVYWSINSSKLKDGIDFTLPAIAGGKSYSGGSFIISSEEAGNISTLITTWRANGVVIDGPISAPFSAPIFNKLTSWPRAILDLKNDSLLIPYYSDAGVPSSSYITEGNTTQLNICGDLYALPHADPQDWPISYVTALKNYINDGGSLWVGCHAVSALDLGWSGPPIYPGFNFLTTNGLVPWTDHSKPSNSSVYAYDASTASDPIMQFMGRMDASFHNGSEEIYLPKIGSSWRSSTKVAVYNPNYIDANTHITYSSPNLAALVAYGPAYGDNSKGMVMYEAGHSYDGTGTIASQIATERAFFNFILLAGIQKKINIILPSNFPTAITPNTSYSLSAMTSGTIGSISYQWSVEGGGTFSSTTTNPTTYTSPSNVGNIVIRLKVTDSCGRSNFISVFMNGGSKVSCASEATLPATPTFSDNCGNTIAFSDPVITESNPLSPCNATKTYTWSYTDYSSCNPSAIPYNRTWSYVYTIKDETAPVWTTPAGTLNRNVECGNSSDLLSVQSLSPTATDCNSNVTYNKISGDFVANSCGGTYTNTWQASDICNNVSSVFTQIITIIDTTKPEFVESLPTDITVSCYSIPTAPILTATDNCGSAPVTLVETGTNGTCATNYTIVRTWTATDTCDNKITTTQNVTVLSPIIDANNDIGTIINGASGGIAFSNVLINDTINDIPVTSSQVILTLINSSNSGITLDGTDVKVAPGTPEGNYTLTYQICEVGNLTNCDTAIVYLTVTKAPIIANNDSIVGGNGTTGSPNAGNVLLNNGNGSDTLNEIPVTIDKVNLTILTPALPINENPVPSINIHTGQISIPEGTPAGSYSIEYQICEQLNPTNCDRAIVTILVTAPIIDAIDEAYYNINCSANNMVGNLLANDILNGNSIVLNDINLTILSVNSPKIVIDNSGNITVLSGIAAGIYSITYKICEILNPNNCDSATVLLSVDTNPILATFTPIAPLCFGNEAPSLPTSSLEGITGTWSPATISNTASGNYIFTPNSGQCATTTAEISVVVNSDIKKTTEYVKCNNDIDLKINLSSLLPAETPTGGTWSEIVIPGDIGGLKDDIFFPFGIKTGDHLIKYIVPVGNCFKTVEITINVDNDCVVEAACNFFIHNAFSPNNDGLNEFFEIENINRTDCFPTNNVEIYNRWGVLVFEVDQYDNNTRVFKGNSEGRSTVDKSVELPSGTYFYIIQYTSSDGILNKKDGYLYLTR